MTQYSCTVLEKSRPDSLKKLLTKLKDTITFQKIPQTTIQITGLTAKQFTFTICPIWPFYKQVAQGIEDVPSVFSEEEMLAVSDLAPSVGITMDGRVNQELVVNLLGVKFKEMRANQNEIFVGKEIKAPRNLCRIVGSYIEQIKEFEKGDNELKPDVIRNQGVYYVDGKYYSLHNMPTSFTIKYYDMAKQGQDFMLREYQGILRRCEFVRWNDNVLETSWEARRYDVVEEANEQPSRSRRGERPPENASSRHSKKPHKPFFHTKQLTIIKSPFILLLLPRFYLQFLRQTKKIEENSVFTMILNMSHTTKENETVALSVRFDNAPGNFELYERVKREYKVYKIKTLPSMLNLQNKNVREFIERRFLCKINKEEIYVMPGQEKQLVEFLQSKMEVVGKEKQRLESIEVHEHQLTKILMDKSLSKKLNFYYKLSVKQVSDTDLRVTAGEKSSYVKVVPSYRKPRGAKNTIFTLPYLFDNIFEESLKLSEYLEKVVDISPGSEPVIQYNHERIKSLGEQEEIMKQLVEVMHKCRDGCCVLVVSSGNQVVRRLREAIQESGARCKEKKVVVEYSGEDSSGGNGSVLEEINQTIGKKIHSYKDLGRIAELKGLPNHVVSQELSDAGIDVRENRILFKEHSQFENLINYINVR